jgi:hypothetical protein
MLSGDELKTRPNCGLNDWFQAGNLNFCMTGTAAQLPDWPSPQAHQTIVFFGARHC